MCGILCLITSFCDATNCLDIANDFILKYVSRLLERRGRELTHKIISNGLIFEATVLWQQGDQPAQQPIEDDNFIFLFNGDIFMERDNKSESDTEFLFRSIKSTETEQEFINLFKELRGPFSLICYNKKTRHLYFMRDSLGRNSLLIGKTRENFYFLTSVIEKSTGTLVIELPPLGIYSLDLNQSEISINLYPWKQLDSHDHYLDEFKRTNEFLNNGIAVKEAIEPDWLLKDPQWKLTYNFQKILENRNNLQESEIMEFLLKIPEVSSACDRLLALLEASVEERVTHTPNLCRNCIEHRSNLTKCDHVKIGILFSGGIDCSILTVLADKFIDKSLPIDLLNVAFEKVNHDPKKKNQAIDWNVPDRITGRDTWKELQSIRPDRQWNFVEVNIDRRELNETLKRDIVNLVYPLETVLDESLGGAMWFAARGVGSLDNVPYESSCRVLLVGSGADELFGGYTRHRNAFKRGGYDLLEQELLLDWVRLPGRNLARDDRIIGDHGITGRSPYVQENFAKFIQSLTPLQKCYHQLEPGIGDKLLLRLCGFKLGLRNCSQFKKRALQFGSRIADRKQNAKQTSNYFQSDE